MFRSQKTEARKQKSDLSSVICHLSSDKVGFTLIEVMVTVAVLSLGTLLIHQGLLRFAGVLGHFNHVLTAQEYAETKRWEARESIFFSDQGSAKEGGGGRFTESGKDFDWSVNMNQEPETDELYMIQVEIDWQEGHKPVSYKPATLATFTKRSGL